MRHAPVLAAAVCLLVTGCAGSLGATAATHPPTAANAARGASAIPSPTPSTTPAPPPPPAAATASPTPAASTYLFDVTSRPECGVPDGTVPATGQEIVISLSCQELTAYQDGVPVLSTPVTTGRPALPTPTGHHSVLRRSSPYRMVSSWPYGTIGWYAPAWVSWVLWFRGDGYGIHDAPWRSAYGPGTEAAGSHGCVNVPHDAMRQLYAWAANGAAVDVL